MSEAKYARWVKQGRGQGRGADYRPWLTIADVPSLGLTSRFTSATVARMHTTFSKIEAGVLLELDWSGKCLDIREQFPLPRVETIPIAEDMKIAHPRADGIDIVMTTDVLVDVAATPDAPSGLLAISCKPSTDLGDGRTLEKLEIERRFWDARGVPFRIVTEADIVRDRVLALTLLADKRKLNGLIVPRPDYWPEVCGIVLDELGSASDPTPAAMMKRLESKHGWREGDGLTALAHLAANRRVLFDLDAGWNARGPLTGIRVASTSTRDLRVAA